MLFDFGPQRYGVADIFAYMKAELIFFSFRQKKKATLQNTTVNTLQPVYSTGI